MGERDQFDKMRDDRISTALESLATALSRGNLTAPAASVSTKIEKTYVCTKCAKEYAGKGAKMGLLSHMKGCNGPKVAG